MQTPQIQQCQACTALREAQTALQRTIWEMTEQKWQALQYNMDTCILDDEILVLARFNRILTKRLHNNLYPHCQIKDSDLLKLIAPHLHSRKKSFCNC